MSNRSSGRVSCITLALCLLAAGAAGKDDNEEWFWYGHDAGGTRYSPLDQIRRGNVTQLKVAWTYHTGDLSDGETNPTPSAFECTPVLADGVMYLTTPFARVIALDGETGKELWSFDPKIDMNRVNGMFINRGVALWRRGSESRVYFGTQAGRLFALEAATGKPLATFGEGGSIDLRKDAADAFPNRGYGMTSPPLVFENLVITGAQTADGEPRGPNGDVRAWDADTGKLVWRFHSVPHPGEFGHETWQEGSWKERGGTNAWSIMACDPERGMLFLPLTSPSPDRYGGERKGQNLFGNSLVALDIRTGKRIWHYQIVHHDLWDWDLPAQPILITIRRAGHSIPAVAQITKMGFIFILDRVSGKPLFQVDERPVPQSEVPGEKTWPTQPVPVLPPPVARLTMRPDEVTDVTPESRAECLKILENAKLGALYQPPGLELTVIFPGTNGGPNWGGGSYDPIARLLFVNSMDVGQIVKMVEAREGSAVAYVSRGIKQGRFWDSNQYPCQKPPWAALTAIDVDSGQIRWRKTLGVIDALLERGIPPTGTSNLGGSIVTAGGLVFIAATNDSRFRAFDRDTGDELWVTRLPASGHATPITYKGKRTGKQFVVIAAGGGNKYNKIFSDSVVAFALP